MIRSARALARTFQTNRKISTKILRRYAMAQPIHTEPSCIFCKIIAGTIPSIKILETERTFAFMDINPLSKGHCLVIPKYHAVKLHQLPAEEMADLGPVLARVAKALNVTDYNILQNNGAPAHQVVEHVHFHIIPKPNSTEGLGIKWPSQKADQDQVKAFCEEVKGRL